MGVPAAILGLTAVSTVLAGISAYGQAQAQKNAAEYQARIAEINAEIAERAARSELAAGRRQEDLARRRAAQLTGRQRTALAAAGVDLQSGTPMDILLETAGLLAEDVSQIRTEAERAAYRQRLGAVSSAAQRQLFRAEAGSTSPAFSAGTTLLGGATQFAERYYRYFGD